MYQPTPQHYPTPTVCYLSLFDCPLGCLLQSLRRGVLPLQVTSGYNFPRTPKTPKTPLTKLARIMDFPDEEEEEAAVVAAAAPAAASGATAPSTLVATEGQGLAAPGAPSSGTVPFCCVRVFARAALFACCIALLHTLVTRRRIRH